MQQGRRGNRWEFPLRVSSAPTNTLGAFGVGLLLSYAVGALPDANGNHYYLQIVLPGSILGLICAVPGAGADAPNGVSPASKRSSSRPSR